MVSAAQSTGAGSLPGALQRLVSDLTEPKMDWREILQQQIMSTIKSDYTWMRPSRKSWHTSAILPGQNNDEMILNFRRRTCGSKIHCSTRGGTNQKSINER